MENLDISQTESIYNDIKSLIVQARQRTMAVVNTTMVQTYWQIGKIIVEAQGGEARLRMESDLLMNSPQNLLQILGKALRGQICEI